MPYTPCTIVSLLEDDGNSSERNPDVLREDTVRRVCTLILYIVITLQIIEILS